MGDAFTSSMSPFSLFSNSPLMPAPAWSSRQIERAYGNILERGRNIALRNAQRKPFDDGCFSDAGLTGENGIVLAAAHQDIDDLPDFDVASKHGIELAAFGFFRQIDGELIEVLSLAAACRARRSVRSVLFRSCGDLVLHRTAHNGDEIFFESIRFELHAALC